MEQPRPSRAVAYVPPGHYESAARCLDHIDQQGYEFKGIVQDWDVVQQMFSRREITVGVVADPRDLDPGRRPRIEFASHPPATGPGGKYWDERTRVIRQPVAGE